MPKPGVYAQSAEFRAKWDRLIALRDDVKKVLEQARADKVIGASLEASVTLHCTGELAEFVRSVPQNELEDLLIVSQVKICEDDAGTKGEVEGLGVSVERVQGHKCERCWKYTSDVGSHPEHPTLCARCASVLED